MTILEYHSPLHPHLLIFSATQHVTRFIFHKSRDLSEVSPILGDSGADRGAGGKLGRAETTAEGEGAGEDYPRLSGLV